MAIIPVKGTGAVGIVQDTPSVLLPPNAWSDGRNVRFDNDSVSKIKGEVSIIDTDVTPEFIQYWPRPVTQYYVYGNSTDVYRVDATGVSTSIGSGYEVLSKWHTTLFNGGFTVLLNNAVETPQFISYAQDNSDTTLADLPGWNYTDTTVTAGVVRAFGNVIVAGNLTEVDTSGGGSVTNLFPSTVRVSTRAAPGGLPSTFEPGTLGNLTTADEFELATPDEIIEIVEISRGQSIVYTRNSFWSLTVDATASRVNLLSPTYGCRNINCVTSFENKHFVVGLNDVYVHGGSSSVTSVIDGKFRDYLFENLHPTFAGNIFTQLNAQQDEVWICFPNLVSGVLNGRCNEALIFNYRSQTWTKRDLPGTLSATEGPIAGGGLPTWRITSDTDVVLTTELDNAGNPIGIVSTGRVETFAGAREVQTISVDPDATLTTSNNQADNEQQTITIDDGATLLTADTDGAFATHTVSIDAAVEAVSGITGLRSVVDLNYAGMRSNFVGNFGAVNEIVTFTVPTNFYSGVSGAVSYSAGPSTPGTYHIGARPSGVSGGTIVGTTPDGTNGGTVTAGTTVGLTALAEPSATTTDFWGFDAGDYVFGPGAGAFEFPNDAGVLPGLDPRENNTTPINVGPFPRGNRTGWYIRDGSNFQDSIFWKGVEVLRMQDANAFNTPGVPIAGDTGPLPLGSGAFIDQEGYRYYRGDDFTTYFGPTLGTAGQNTQVYTVRREVQTTARGPSSNFATGYSTPFLAEPSTDPDDFWGRDGQFGANQMSLAGTLPRATHTDTPPIRLWYQTNGGGRTHYERTTAGTVSIFWEGHRIVYNGTEINSAFYDHDGYRYTRGSRNLTSTQPTIFDVRREPRPGGLSQATVSLSSEGSNYASATTTLTAGGGGSTTTLNSAIILPAGNTWSLSTSSLTPAVWSLDLDNSDTVLTGAVGTQTATQGQGFTAFLTDAKNVIDSIYSGQGVTTAVSSNVLTISTNSPGVISQNFSFVMNSANGVGTLAATVQGTGGVDNSALTTISVSDEDGTNITSQTFSVDNINNNNAQAIAAFVASTIQANDEMPIDFDAVNDSANSRVRLTADVEGVTASSWMVSIDNGAAPVNHVGNITYTTAVEVVGVDPTLSPTVLIDYPGGSSGIIQIGAVETGGVAVTRDSGQIATIIRTNATFVADALTAGWTVGGSGNDVELVRGDLTPVVGNTTVTSTLISTVAQIAGIGISTGPTVTLTNPDGNVETTLALFNADDALSTKTSSQIAAEIRSRLSIADWAISGSQGTVVFTHTISTAVSGQWILTVDNLGTSGTDTATFNDADFVTTEVTFVPIGTAPVFTITQPDGNITVIDEFNNTDNPETRSATEIATALRDNLSVAGWVVEGTGLDIILTSSTTGVILPTWDVSRVAQGTSGTTQGDVSTGSFTTTVNREGTVDIPLGTPTEVVARFGDVELTDPDSDVIPLKRTFSFSDGETHLEAITVIRDWFTTAATGAVAVTLLQTDVEDATLSDTERAFTATQTNLGVTDFGLELEITEQGSVGHKLAGDIEGDVPFRTTPAVFTLTNIGNDETLDPNRPWPQEELNTSRRFLVLAGTEADQLLATDISNQFNGSNFTAFVERQKLDMGGLDATKWASTIYPLIDGSGSVTIKASTSNSFGAPVDFESRSAYTGTFDIASDYKLDTRVNGRFASYRFESTDDDDWRLAGFSFNAEVSDKR